MEDWVSVAGREKGIRSSFLVNRKPTETEIYQTKGLLREIQRATTAIETLLEEQGSCGIRPNVRSQLEENTVRLAFAGESLNEMMNDNKGLRDQLAFDIARFRKNAKKILEKVLSCSGG